MIIANLFDSHRIESLHPLFPELFSYLRTHDLLNMPEGRIELKGDQLYINNVRPQGVTAEEQKMEVHRKYIDIHILLEGAEKIGWKSLKDCKNPTANFDEENDFQLFSDQPSTYISYQPGEFVICYPEDAHAPLIGSGTIKKCIVKILL